jgi:hypothetical protein
MLNKDGQRKKIRSKKGSRLCKNCNKYVKKYNEAIDDHAVTIDDVDCSHRDKVKYLEVTGDKEYLDNKRRFRRLAAYCPYYHKSQKNSTYSRMKRLVSIEKAKNTKLTKQLTYDKSTMAEFVRLEP